MSFASGAGVLIDDKRGSRTLARQNPICCSTSELSWVAKDRDACGTRERQSRRAPVRVHEPQPLTRIAFSNVGIGDTLTRPSKFIICVGKSSAQEKAPVGDTDQGFVCMKTWKAAPPSS
jgi:hypothetical protein